MKFLVVVLAILGLALAKPAPRDLDDDFQELLALIPFGDLADIVDDHLANDGAFADVVLYLQGDDWITLRDDVLGMDDVKDFIQYLDEAGIDVDLVLSTVFDYVDGLKPTAEPNTDGSLADLLSEVVAAIPVDKLLSFLNDKLQNSTDVQNLYTEISSEKAHQLVLKVAEIEEVQRILQQLRDFDVPIDDIIDTVFAFLGWPSP